MTYKPSPITPTLPGRFYGRDPLDIVIEKEIATCRGCKHLLVVLFHGIPAQSCDKGRKRRSAKCYTQAAGTTCQGGR